MFISINKNKIKSGKNQGFTLLELSISIIVLSLLISVTLMAKDLIDSAKIKRIFSEKNSLEIAITGFKAKYGFIPGSINGVNKARLLGDISTNYFTINNPNPNSVNYMLDNGKQAANAFIMLRKATEGGIGISQATKDDNINGKGQNGQWASYSTFFPTSKFDPGAMWIFGTAGDNDPSGDYVTHRLLLVSSVYPYLAENNHVVDVNASPILTNETALLIKDKYAGNGGIEFLSYDSTITGLRYPTVVNECLGAAYTIA